MRTTFALTIAGTLCLTLGACDGTKKALGFEKSVPDEYRVLSHPPLALPPEYGLRPPRPGEERPQSVSATERAQKKLIGEAGGSNAQRSEAENSFLKQAGAESADPNIRDVIGGEQESLNAEPGFWEKLKDGSLIVDKKVSEKGIAIDPYKEKQRLSSGAAEEAQKDSSAETDAKTDDASDEEK